MKFHLTRSAIISNRPPELIADLVHFGVNWTPPRTKQDGSFSNLFQLLCRLFPLSKHENNRIIKSCTEKGKNLFVSFSFRDRSVDEPIFTCVGCPYIVTPNGFFLSASVAIQFPSWLLCGKDNTKNFSTFSRRKRSTTDNSTKEEFVVCRDEKKRKRPKQMIVLTREKNIASRERVKLRIPWSTSFSFPPWRSQARGGESSADSCR